MRRLLALAFAALAFGCYPGVSYESLLDDGGTGGGGGGGSNGGGGGAVSSSDGGASGLPCDVDTTLRARCQSCHGVYPSGGAPMALVTYEDLVKPAGSNPAKTNAQVSADRMRDTAAPMPPAGLPPASEVAAFDTWISSGYPTGSCGQPVDAGPDPFAVAAKCTSGTNYTAGNNSRMRPGEACIACHALKGAPLFSIAGTVYPSAHEPDSCNSALPSGVKIVVTGANNASFSLTPNSAGNFSSYSVPLSPYHVKVTYAGRERAMAAAVTSGDCNSCHTQYGSSNAPGRILIP